MKLLLKSKSSLLLFINFLFLSIILFYKTKNSIYFNGLPFNNIYEVITIFIILPCLLIINNSFIKKRIVTVLLIIILFLKISLNFFFEENGLKFNSYFQYNHNYIDNKISSLSSINDSTINVIKNYEKKDHLFYGSDNFSKKLKEFKKWNNNNNFNKKIIYGTNSFWKKNKINSINSNLKNKKLFPIDWAKGLTTEQFSNLTFNFILEGFVYLDESEILLIETKGLLNKNNLNKDNKNIVYINDINNFKNVFKNNISGYYNVYESNLQFQGDNWSLKFYIYNTSKDTYQNAFKANRLFLKEYENYSLNKINLNLILQYLFNYSLIIIFIIYLFNSIQILYKKHFSENSYFGIFFNIICFLSPLLSLFFVNFIIKNLTNFEDKTNLIILGLSIIFNLFLIYTVHKLFNIFKNSNGNQIIKIIVLYVLMPNLLILTYLNIPTIKELENYAVILGDQFGNDWSTMNILARLILVNGDHLTSRFCIASLYGLFDINWIYYINIKEVRDLVCGNNSYLDVYHHNPLPRYIFSLFFLLFGQGSFSFMLIDIWSIYIICIYFIYFFYNKISSNAFSLVIFFSIFYFLSFFLGPYRHFIGIGKEEYIAAALMFICMYFIYEGHNKKVIYTILGGIFAFLGILSRLDHIIIISIFFIAFFEPLKGSIYQIINSIINKIILHYKKIIIYVFFILFSVALIILRHFNITNDLTLMHPFLVSDSLNFESKLNVYFKSLYTVLSANSGGYEFPKFPSIILVVGIISSLFLAILKIKNSNNNYPISFSIIIISILISYFVFRPQAYHPRWSIHLLPFATMYFTIIFYSLFYKLLKK